MARFHHMPLKHTEVGSTSRQETPIIFPSGELRPSHSSKPREINLKRNALSRPEWGEPIKSGSNMPSSRDSVQDKVQITSNVIFATPVFNQHHCRSSRHAAWTLIQ